MIKIAYLLSVHDDSCHLFKLIEALQPDADFFVHVDAKVDSSRFAACRKWKNVHFIEERYDICWGEISQVHYQAALLRAALHSGKTFDRLVTLSGLDYPVWSNARIQKFLADSPNTEYICGIDMTQQRQEIQRLYRMYRPFPGLKWLGTHLRVFIRTRSRKLLYLFGIRKPLTINIQGCFSYRLYKGSSWWCITPPLARYLLDTFEAHPEIESYFKTSFGPDETLWQTLVFNSPYAHKACLVKGDYTSLADLTPLHYIYYSPVIKVLTNEDLPAILESGRMFCRKTCTGASDSLMEKIDTLRYKEEVSYSL